MKTAGDPNLNAYEELVVQAEQGFYAACIPCEVDGERAIFMTVAEPRKLPETEQEGLIGACAIILRAHREARKQGVHTVN